MTNKCKNCERLNAVVGAARMLSAYSKIDEYSETAAPHYGRLVDAIKALADNSTHDPDRQGRFECPACGSSSGTEDFNGMTICCDCGATLSDCSRRGK